MSRTMTPAERATKLVNGWLEESRGLPLPLSITRLGLRAAEAIEQAEEEAERVGNGRAQRHVRRASGGGEARQNARVWTKDMLLRRLKALRESIEEEMEDAGLPEGLTLADSQASVLYEVCRALGFDDGDTKYVLSDTIFSRLTEEKVRAR